MGCFVTPRNGPQHKVFGFSAGHSCDEGSRIAMPPKSARVVGRVTSEPIVRSDVDAGLIDLSGP